MVLSLSLRSLAIAVAAAVAATAHGLPAVTFDEAWRRVLAASPEPAVLAAALEAIAAEAGQAALRPNPAISAEVENVLGTRHYRGVDETELTVQLTQTIERGDKPQLRHRLAGSAGPIAEAELAVKLADLRQRAANAFTATLVAQEKTKLRKQAVEIAQRTAETIRRQRDAGQASGIEFARANLELSSAHVAADAAGTELAHSRRALAALWNGVESDVPAVAGDMSVPEAPPAFEMLAARIESTPDLRRFEAETRRREATVALEKSVAKADVTVGGGVRYFRAGADAALVLGLSIPWQVRHQNQGAVRAAQARLRQVPLEAESAKLKLRAEFAQSWALAVAAHREAIALARDIAPAAEALVREYEAALRQGRTSLLPVLEAQRTLLATRERQLDAVARFLQAGVVLERLTRSAEAALLPSP